MSLKLKDIYLLNEGSDDNVVDFQKFKRSREPVKRRAFIISKDGMMLFSPDEFYYVIVTDEDQGDAFVDGNIKVAMDRGAEVHELAPGKQLSEVDLTGKK